MMMTVMKLYEGKYLTDQQIKLAGEYARNPERFQISPSHAAILDDLVFNDVLLEQLEARRNWPARSAKVILCILLDGLDSHRVSTPAPRKPNPQRDRDTLEYLTGMHPDDAVDLMHRFGLTVQESRVLAAMIRSKLKVCTREYLCAAMYADKNGDGEPKNLDVAMCKVRKKIRGSNMRIETLNGIGFCLIVETAAPVPGAEIIRLSQKKSA